MSVDAAAGQIVFRISLGTHHFLSIAKLRAARRLWANVVAACGGSSSAGAMQIHARTSNRVLTQRDPYVNLLRNTVAAFSAGVGGADAITSVPFDHLTGPPDEFSRRVARNTVLVLQEEAHLHRVIDPAGGSWFLDQLTEQVATTGWKVFQQVEGQGGMLKALESGWIAQQIDAAFAPRAKDIARRKEGITGVSEFPNVREERVAHTPPPLEALQQAASQRAGVRKSLMVIQCFRGWRQRPMIARAAAVEAAIAGASIGQMAAPWASISPQKSSYRRWSRAVSPNRSRSCATPATPGWPKTVGDQRVFLANMGPVAHYTARANYARRISSRRAALRCSASIVSTTC